MPCRCSSEFYLRGLAGIFARCEFRHRLIGAEECIGPNDTGERPQLRIVEAYRLDVVAPGNRDAVLGAFELRLECQEVLVGLEVGIILTDGNEPAERPGQLVLRILELLTVSGSVNCETSTLVCVALARASTTAVRTSRSCLA